MTPGHGFSHVCERCVLDIRFAEAPACSCCGHPFYGVVHGERVCPHCLGLDAAFGNGVTTVLFKGPARSMVIELKYHRGLYLLDDFEELFRRSSRVLEFVGDAVLVPVPLHVRKWRDRGYNQSELLAEALVKAGGGRARIAPLLARSLDTGSQTLLDRPTRLRNLRGAFALKAGATVDPQQRYVLADDVFTTGATLNSCANALRKAGALHVDVVTFGHG